MTKYNLNAMALDFTKYHSFEIDKTYSTQELEEIYRASAYFNDVLNSYYPSAIKKSIWYGLKRNPDWIQIQRGYYKKIK